MSRYPDSPVWSVFHSLASVPRPSGHEQEAAALVMRLASEHGFAARRDRAGNVRIDRPASPGFESAPALILQGHLDMVPCAREGVSFDFLHTGIPVRRTGDWLVSDAGTTLGGDDGIGVALALSLLFDPDPCGARACVFTVSEETGLNGALGIDASFLEGDYLLNLDSEEEGIFYVGCAGGCVVRAVSAPEREACPAETLWFHVNLTGLAGGHSGMEIASGRGNALCFLADFLRSVPEVRISSFSGGTVDNAIPASACADCAIPADCADSFRSAADEFADTLRKKYSLPAEFRIHADSCAPLGTVWRNSFRDAYLTALADCPYGPVSMSEEYRTVHTSCNPAVVKTDGVFMMTEISLRSLQNDSRDALRTNISDRFRGVSREIHHEREYTAWTPSPDRTLPEKAARCWDSQFGRVPGIRVIHAGLECGILLARNPNLCAISFGPEVCAVHTPDERVNIESVERFELFLKKFAFSLQKAEKAD